MTIHPPQNQQGCSMAGPDPYLSCLLIARGTSLGLAGPVPQAGPVPLDATFQIDGVPKILQPVPETEMLHVRGLMQGKPKPFYKHVNFFFCSG